MNKFSKFLYRLSTGWVSLIALVIFLVFTATVLPAQSSRAASDGVSTPDLSFWYSPTSLYEMAESNGAAGRQVFVRSHFTFDVVWPLVYGFFLVTNLSWLLWRGFQENSPWRLANLVPLAALLFDFLENITTSLVMARYPSETLLAAELAPFCTMLKWIFVGFSIVLLLIGAVAAFTKALRYKQNR